MMAKAQPVQPSEATAVPVKASRNSSRNLTKGLLKMCDAQNLEPYMATIPMWDNHNEEQVMREASFFPIHEALDHIIEPGKEMDYASLDEPSQIGFRQELLDWQSRTSSTLSLPYICLALWGDTAPMSHRDSLCLLTVRILSGVHKCRIWIWGASKNQLCQCGCKGRHTMDSVWRIVAWMFRACMAGRWPMVDHNGDRWRIGSRAVRAVRAGQPLRTAASCIAKTGDWMWFKQVLNLQSWQVRKGTDRLCWMCHACRDNAFDTTPVATWRSTITSMQDIVKPTSRDSFTSAFWEIPGTTLATVKADWMHVVDLGVLQSCVGAIVFDLFIELGGSYANPKPACGRLLKLFRSVARDMDCDLPFASLTVHMMRAAWDKKPKMKLKAAEGRYFAPILLQVLKECFATTSSYQLLRIEVLDTLCKCYTLFQNWEGISSTHQLTRLARRHVMLYQEMHRMTADKLCFVVQPKHHIMLHLAENSWSNPATEWCYGDESQIGKAVKVVSNSARPNIVTHLIKRYIITRQWM